MRYCNVRDGTVPCGIFGLRTVSYRVVMYSRMRLRGGVISRGNCTDVEDPLNVPLEYCAGCKCARVCVAPCEWVGVRITLRKPLSVFDESTCSEGGGSGKKDPDPS